jgi:hypothetical protein
MTQREQENIDVLEFRNQLDLLLTEANKMFEEQIIESCDNAQRTDFYVKYYGTEQYYNETFKPE